MEDPRDRLRRQLAQEFAPIIAELAAKVDKGSRHQSLADLRCPAAAHLYIERAVEFLLGPGPRARMADVQVAQAYQRAAKDDELETIERQARADVEKYGITGDGRTH